MAFFKRKGEKKKKHKFRLVINHVEGLSVFNLQEDITIALDLENNRVSFTSAMDKNKPEVSLDFEKIKSIKEITDKEVIEKNKSVVGRAAVGTLIAGPLGTIVGGLSGTGSNKEVKEKRIVTIGYESQGEDKDIVLIQGQYSFDFEMDRVLGELRRLVAQYQITEEGNIDL